MAKRPVGEFLDQRAAASGRGIFSGGRRCERWAERVAVLNTANSERGLALGAFHSSGPVRVERITARKPVTGDERRSIHASSTRRLQLDDAKRALAARDHHTCGVRAPRTDPRRRAGFAAASFSASARHSFTDFPASTAVAPGAGSNARIWRASADAGRFQSMAASLLAIFGA